MKQKNVPEPPFFEIGPKSYLYGDDVLELALAAERASEKYDVDIIFTTPYTDIRRVAEATERLFVYAPHMDLQEPGRGLADILPEAVKAAGAVGVMLNHCEKPLALSTLEKSIRRAHGIGLAAIVCARYHSGGTRDCVSESGYHCGGAFRTDRYRTDEEYGLCKSFHRSGTQHKPGDSSTPGCRNFKRRGCIPIDISWSTGHRSFEQYSKSKR